MDLVVDDASDFSGALILPAYDSSWVPSIPLATGFRLKVASCGR